MAAAAPGAEDSLFEASAFERVLARRPPRWIGWRRRLLMFVALAACVGLFALVRLLAHSPSLGAQWQSDARGRPVLLATDNPSLTPYLGRTLVGLASNGTVLGPGNIAARGTPRWTLDDRDRAALIQARSSLHQILTSRDVALLFDDGSEVRVTPVSLGHGGLGLSFWMLAIPALALFLIGIVVVVAKPMPVNLLFSLMATCQAISLLWTGVESSSMLAPVSAWLANDFPWRLGLDLTTAAAAVQAFAIYPRRVDGGQGVALLAWAVAAMVTASVALTDVPYAWWLGQGTILLMGSASLILLSRSYAEEPNPFAMVMRRFGIAALGTMVVVDASLVTANWQSGLAGTVAASAVVVWSLFFASLMALVPFLSRARGLLREFAMLAGLSTVATSLDLLFITLFSLEPFASLTLAVFIALAGYAAARQWMLDQMVGSRVMTTERTFEQLYRVARDVQKTPERTPALVAQLLRGLFDPMEVLQVHRTAPRSKVLADGSALVVPMRTRSDREPLSLVLRFSRQGRRIFTREDARLTDRVVEQLRRAVAYDQAVERGRTEERQRIAQDLHDDIGARLLTLMYKSQDPEIEDYLRHTLQDLKTLTRGLAAADHRTSHSVAEWKADIQQRLTAAHIELDWSFVMDDDPELGVVQWSALTRILRELVSNAIYHARATRIEISGRLHAGALELHVADDGIGRNPHHWSHGLGLGGVRKRVKVLGGQVDWQENGTRGIVCRVRIAEFLSKP